MKKIVALILMATMLFYVSACGAPHGGVGDGADVGAGSGNTASEINGGEPSGTNGSLQEGGEPLSVSLGREEHPELDFGLEASGGAPAICDFYITPENHLLLLELSKSLYEYDSDGTLLQVYDYGLAEKGLTAYKVACDDDGSFYLLDGHSQQIIKAGKNGITRVSAVPKCRVGDYELDVATTTSFYALGDDTICLAAWAGDSYTFTFDVSGETAELVGQPMPGRIICEGMSYTASHVPSGEKTISESMEVEIRKNDVTRKRFRVSTTPGRYLIGTVILGQTKENEYVAQFVELTDESGNSQTTVAKLDEEGNVLAVCKTEIQPGHTLKSINGEVYVFQNDGEAIRVDEFSRLYGDWTQEHWFSTV